MAPPSEAFVGRAAETSRLEGLFAKKERVIVVSGAAGVGKTSLVKHAALRFVHAQDARATSWWCDLTEARSAIDVCAALGRCLGVTLRGLTEVDATRQLAHAIAGRGGAIVVLDAIEGCRDAVASMLKTLVHPAPRARFVLTSRSPASIRGAVTFAIDPLSDRDATKMLEGASLGKSDAEAIASIVRLTKGMPLALHFVRTMAMATPLVELADRLARRGKNARVEDAVNSAILWTYDALSTASRRALAQTSIFRAGFTREAADAVIAIGDDPALSIVLRELEARGLVTRSGNESERFVMHACVRAFAAELLAKSRDAEATARRHANYYLARAIEVGAGDRSIVAKERDRGERDIANIMAAYVFTLARPKSVETAREALRAAIAIGPIFSARGPLGNDYAVLDMALEFSEGQAIEPQLRGNALVARGEVWRVQGRLEEARADLEEARALAKATDDQQLEGLSIAALGRVHHSGGRLDEAHTHYERALALAREARDHELEAKTLGNLALVYRLRKRYRDALAHAERALELHRRTGNARLEADLLGVIGTLYQGQTLMEEARDHYERAIHLLHEVCEPALEGSVTGNLGTLQHELGDLEASRATTEHALEIFRRIGARHLEARARGQLASLAAEAGKFEEARAHYVDAIEALDELGEWSDGAFFRAQLGGVLASMGRVDDATVMFEKAEQAWRASPREGPNDWAALQRGHLEIALAKRAAMVGDRTKAEELRAMARARIEALETSEPDEPIAHSDDVRVAIRMLKRAMAEELPVTVHAKAKKRVLAKSR